MCGINDALSHKFVIKWNSQTDFMLMSWTHFSLSLISISRNRTNYTNRIHGQATYVRLIKCACARFKTNAVLQLGSITRIAMRQCDAQMNVNTMCACVLVVTSNTLILVSTGPKYDVMHDILRCTLCSTSLCCGWTAYVQWFEYVWTQWIVLLVGAVVIVVIVIQICNNNTLILQSVQFSWDLTWN